MKFEILSQNGEVDRVIELDVGSSIRIGKTASCELSLDDSSVSRTHAVIEKTDAGYKLSDRMTPGGTYVNDQKVDPNNPVIFSSGSILKFGQISVRVQFDDAASSIEEDEEEGGATVAMEAPSIEDLENAANQMASADAAPAPAVAAVQTPSAAKMAAVAAPAAAAARPGRTDGASRRSWPGTPAA